MSAEKWVAIAGYEGRYEISDEGRVRSVARRVPSTRWNPNGTRLIKSRLLAVHTWGAQYPGIVLHDGGGLAVRKMVHQLVAFAFVPNPNGYPFINHLDADTFNPRASNLEWCNQSINVAHSYAIGNRDVGEDHHFSRMDRDARGHVVRSEELQ